MAGYAARREPLEGGCRQYGCRRKYWVDEHAYHEQLLASMRLDRLVALFRCNRPDGCGFNFHGPSARQSVRLTVVTGLPNARIRIRCDACDWFRLPKAEEVAAILTKDGKSGPYTCIHEVAGAMTRPCPKCKQNRWAAELVWLATDTAVWRAKGEQLFEEITARSPLGRR